MPEINELTAIDPADVSDDDLLVIFDMSAPSGSEAKKVTRAQLLSGVARESQDVSLGVVDADELNAPTGAIDELTISTGLTMGATLGAMVLGTASLTVATLASLATETQTKTITGAIVGDFVILRAPSTLPAGMVLTCAISASNTLQVKAVNATGASIPGATYAVSVLLLRAS